MPLPVTGNTLDMLLLLLVPISLATLVSLLALAAHLEKRSTQFLVRLTVRGPSSPETTENLVAAELAPLLAAAGLDHRTT